MCRIILVLALFVTGCASNYKVEPKVLDDKEERVTLLSWYGKPPALIGDIGGANDEDFYRLVQWDSACEASTLFYSEKLAISGSYMDSKRYYDLASVFSANKELLKMRLDMPPHIFEEMEKNRELIGRPKGEGRYLSSMGSTVMRRYLDEVKVARAKACSESAMTVNEISKQLLKRRGGR